MYSLPSTSHFREPSAANSAVVDPITGNGECHAHVVGHAAGDHPASAGIQLPRPRIAVHEYLFDAAARRLRRHDCPLAYHRHKLL